MKLKMELGPTPPNESCVQVGEDNYDTRAYNECTRYIDCIRKKLGKEPKGARLGITANNHDFGTYYEDNFFNYTHYMDA